MRLVIVHGGADNRVDTLPLEPLEKAALAGYRTMDKSTLQASERAVMAMEDDLLFNAGHGSVLNLDGVVEMDAAVMDGATGRCGVVAAVRNVRNPVSLARMVMEKSQHVFLAGEGAVRFARDQGIAYFDPVTKQQQDAWEKAISALNRGAEPPVCALDGHSAHDTVGCIAYNQGCLAAASSTGGISLKLPGRVGDTGVIGAGIFASPRGAVVCTGLGEVFIQLNAAAWIVSLLERGVNVHDAARAGIRRVAEKNASGGILAVDAAGNAAAVYNSAHFPVALVVDGRPVREFVPEKL